MIVRERKKITCCKRRQMMNKRSKVCLSIQTMRSNVFELIYVQLIGSVWLIVIYAFWNPLLVFLIIKTHQWMYTEKKAVIVCRCSHLTIKIVKPHLTANYTTQKKILGCWENTPKVWKSRARFTNFSQILSTSRVGYYNSKSIGRGVYCFNNW